MADINISIIYDDITVLENIGIDNNFLINVNDTVTAVSLAEAQPDVLHINVSDASFITEWASYVADPLIELYEEIVTSESFLYAPNYWNVSVNEIISILTDYVEFGFTPKYLSVAEDVIYLTEYLDTFDFTESGISVETISITEYVSIQKDLAFNDFLRSYPFTVETQTGIVMAEFDNGVTQKRDTWGRNRKAFTINSPPLTKSESVDLEAFYEQNTDRTFPFTNPVTQVPYTVQFMENSFRVERRHFNTFYITFTVVEVFI